MCASNAMNKNRILLVLIILNFFNHLTPYALASSVGVSCNATFPNAAFGNYTLTNTSPVTLALNVAVTCTATTANSQVSYAGTLSAGNAGSSASSRAMYKGTNALQYNFYFDSGYQYVVSNSTPYTNSYTISSAGGSHVDNYVIYAMIPAGQNVPIGNYSDSLIVTLNY